MPNFSPSVRYLLGLLKQQCTASQQGYLSEKCIIRQFQLCVNIVKWIYTNLDGTAYYYNECLYFLFIVVQVQLSPFSCHHFPPPHPPPPPTLNPSPFGFVHGSFTHVPWRPFSFIPMLSPSPLPSGYYQFVLYFNVPGYIFLACLFCWLGSTDRWDHMVFVFHRLGYFTEHTALQIHPCCHEG